MLFDVLEINDLALCAQNATVARRHLVASVRYGDDVQDEWLLVHLARELTRARADIAAQVIAFQ